MDQEVEEDQSEDGWHKGGRGITQHDDPGSHEDCTRPSDLENDPEGAAVACLSSIAKSSK